ncbi:MAG: hypothetical protein KBC41_00870 [Candidatus Pacebacteria bacterium]|nr:hypothetical protein [Candidatus Paceibacterota bacterium]MBP9866615.1 hypothetical protein [Candidatus Paceibacterota bacterium]
MESIKFLITFLFRISIVIFLVAFVWWLVSVLAPSFSPKALILGRPATALDKEGWLPSPRNFNGLFGKVKAPSSQDNVYDGTLYIYKSDTQYEHNNTVEYISYSYPSYANQGIKKATSTNVSSVQNTNNAPKSLYIRNLSLYQNGRIYQGISFTGEAKNIMFLQGKFPVVIVDQATGRVISVSFAEATTDWAIPGWVRFKVTINNVGANKIPCTMVFEQARVQNSQAVPSRVAVPFICN